MVDLHTHILPGIDDGAQTVEEALRLTEALYKQNIRKAVCTPHFDPTKTGLQEFVDNRTAAILQMQSSRVELLTGSETVLHEYLFNHPDLSCLCMEATSYILLELPFTIRWEENIFEMLDKLISYYNLTPVIAHIERYPAARKEKQIRKLIEIGCVIQINAASILDKRYRRRVFRYIRHGIVDVVASDCHNMINRMPVIGEAYERISEKLGNASCSKLQLNAEYIAKGTQLRSKPEYIISLP